MARKGKFKTVVWEWAMTELIDQPGEGGGRFEPCHRKMSETAEVMESETPLSVLDLKKERM